MSERVSVSGGVTMTRSFVGVFCVSGIISVWVGVIMVSGTIFVSVVGDPDVFPVVSAVLLKLFSVFGDVVSFVFVLLAFVDVVSFVSVLGSLSVWVSVTVRVLFVVFVVFVFASPFGSIVSLLVLVEVVSVFVLLFVLVEVFDDVVSLFVLAEVVSVVGAVLCCPVLLSVLVDVASFVL